VTADQQLYFLRMTGRCANGFERDGGRIVHAIRSAGFPGWRPALCGAKPGDRGNGWSEHPPIETPGPPTCPRCRKRLEREGFSW
jgi:hypothetical protein